MGQRGSGRNRVWVVYHPETSGYVPQQRHLLTLPKEADVDDEVLLLSGDPEIRVEGRYEIVGFQLEAGSSRVAELAQTRTTASPDLGDWGPWLQQLAEGTPRALSADEANHLSNLYEALASPRSGPVPPARVAKRHPVVWLLTTNSSRVSSAPIERLPGDVILGDRLVMFRSTGRGVDIAGIFEVVGGKRDDRGVYAQLMRLLEFESPEQLWGKDTQDRLRRLANTTAAKHAGELNVLEPLFAILAELFPDQKEQLRSVFDSTSTGDRPRLQGAGSDATSDSEQRAAVIASCDLHDGTRVLLVVSHSPSGFDAAVCPADEHGTPGLLNQAVISAAGLTTAALRRFKPPAMVLPGGLMPVLVVQTMESGRGVPLARIEASLGSGLRLLVRRIADTRESGNGPADVGPVRQNIWMPLLGTGVANHNPIEAASAIIAAVAEVEWPPAAYTIYLAAPSQTIAEDVANSLSKFHGNSGKELDGVPANEQGTQVEKSRRSMVATTKGAETLVRPGGLPELSTSSGASLSLTVVLSQAATPPPQDKVTDDVVRIHVTERTVELSRGLGSDVFSSPNLLKPEQLVADVLRAKEYGEALYAGTFNETRSQFDKTFASTSSGLSAAILSPRGDMQLQIWCDPNDPAMHDLRWERLWAKDAPAPLSTLESLAFVRRLNGTAMTRVDAAPLRVAFAVCNPSTLGDPRYGALGRLAPIDAAQERAIVETHTAELCKQGLLSLQHVEPRGSLGAIAQVVESGVHVLHLVAHGVMVDRTFYVVLEDENGNHDLVTASRFAAAISAGPREGLRIAILSSCQSAVRTGESQVPLGPYLIMQGIPAVIAMQDVVDFDTAQLFAALFYRQLTRTGRVDTAMAATRHHLFVHDPAKGWDVPVLFLGADDATLLEPALDGRGLPESAPRLRRYDEFDGRGDPRPELLTAAARAVGAAHITETALWDQVRARTVGKQEIDAALQDRRALARVKQLRITASKLREHVEHSANLLFPESLYRQTASALNSGKHIIFIGPPGTGKTALANGVCAFAEAEGMSPGVVCATASADWSTFETVGGFVPTEDHSLRFRQGLVLRAVASGRWLIVDEINRAEIDKAFGELFTMLSGQPVELAWQVAGEPVRIIPPGSGAKWVPPQARVHDVVVHPSWRMIGTMNVYDRSFLFGMSLAFMRRFVFVDVRVPTNGVYAELISKWAGGCEHNAPLSPSIADTICRIMGRLVGSESALMRHRALGPAIVRDMIRFVVDRYQDEACAPASESEAVADAFLLYGVPQCEGLPEETILTIAEEIRALLPDGFDPVRQRIMDLYPHVPREAWLRDSP